MGSCVSKLLRVDQLNSLIGFLIEVSSKVELSHSTVRFSVFGYILQKVKILGRESNDWLDHRKDSNSVV